MHNLKIGNPNNIVFVKQFLDLIEKKLNAKICLYCEGKFKDWQTLKEHMRKKIHKVRERCDLRWSEMIRNDLKGSEGIQSDLN